MTFDQYIQNPMGKKNAVMSNREMYRALYMQKWDAIYMRENGNITYNLYKNESDFFIHLKIPSEVLEDFYYDVVIRFYPDKKGIGSAIERSLVRYSVQFFSNDPAFVFTFIHAFHKRKLFFEDLKEKIPKEAYTQTGHEKNPRNEVGYVKSLYFAYLFMKKRRLFDKIKYEALGKEYKPEQLMMQVEHASSKIRKRQEGGEKLTKKKREEEKLKKIRARRNNLGGVKRTKIVDNIGFVKKTGKMKTTRYSKRI